MEVKATSGDEAESDISKPQCNHSEGGCDSPVILLILFVRLVSLIFLSTLKQEQ